jgi:hypothetical protein
MAVICKHHKNRKNFHILQVWTFLRFFGIILLPVNGEGKPPPLLRLATLLNKNKKGEICLMFEYETEVLNVPGNLRLSLVEDGKFVFDELINKRAADGWELVTHSILWTTTAVFVVTFKREKK